MKLRNSAPAIAFLILTTSASLVRADSYSTFKTTRYYSSNRHYFVVVSEKKVATLYHNGRKLRPVWRQTLPELPRKLIVADDGQRVVLVDGYYGNLRSPTFKAITILDELGKEIQSYQLRDVANLERVRNTTSASYWCGEVGLSPDGKSLEIQTLVGKRACSQGVMSAQEANECRESVPYEQLRFELATGKLIERSLR